MISRIKSSIFNRKRANFSFAQAGEDLVLQRIFMHVTNGFFVDVGAYHPYRMSNTYLFYLNGWRGINIEPRPNSKKLFDKIRPADINLEMGVANTAGVAKYLLFKEHTLNCFDFTDLMNNGSEPSQVIDVEVQPLSTILAGYIPEGKTIDFITIDTEGAEYQVLKSNDWKRFPIKVVVVEENKGNQTYNEVADLLRTKGYVEAYRVPVNSEADSVFFMVK